MVESTKHVDASSKRGLSDWCAFCHRNTQGHGIWQPTRPCWGGHIIVVTPPAGQEFVPHRLRAFGYLGAAVAFSRLVLHCCRYPLRAPAQHSPREAHGAAAGRISLRHVGHLQLRARLPAAGRGFHLLHHQGRDERRVERTAPAVRR